jgi:hypothetical protein
VRHMEDQGLVSAAPAPESLFAASTLAEYRI